MYALSDKSIRINNKMFKIEALSGDLNNFDMIMIDMIYDTIRTWLFEAF